MSIEVKICGLQTKEEVLTALSGGAEYIGFVFFQKSPRNIDYDNGASLAGLVEGKAKTVAVTVDMEDSDIESMLSKFKPDFIQCHGKESPQRVREVKDKFDIRTIKAIAVRCSDDVAKAMDYTDVADMILFDAKAPDSPLPGGNGLSFDWNLLKGREYNIPWMLSGGLNVGNVKEAIAISGANKVDVSSSIESEPGVKDLELINQFLINAKSE